MLKKTLLITLFILIAIQFIRPDKTNPPIDKAIALNSSKDVMNILKNSCFDCHSYETKWPYYSEIAPVSFFVASHVKKGRKALNFSEWKNIDKDIKKARLKRAIMTVNNGMMALPSYVSVHDNAELSKDEKSTLIKWFEKELEILDQ
ncbi:heme-binding domain-containing protein [Sulfurimonas sp.]|uniref:heme-binding domain-containing protein n=1 Tax=Sulfurimonas sp. TaxID=2022749 RepID=UPI0035683D7F